MPVRKANLSTQASQQAARMRARVELTELDLKRFVVEQANDGVSQTAIAEAVGKSQAQISRVLADVAKRPRSLAVTVDEVINRKVLGDVDASGLLTQLSIAKLAYVNPDRRPDSAWAKVRDAHRCGLLSDDDARKIARQTAERMVGRVNLHMALEAQEVSEPAAERSVKETTDRLLATL